MKLNSTTIYFLRHGEVNNPRGIWYGRMPRMALSPEGRKQITQAAQLLLSDNITSIYSSPLLRAKQSGQILAATLKPRQIHSSTKLLEIKSHFQGVPFSYIKEIKADFFSPKNRLPDDETLTDILNRMLKFCHQIAKKHCGDNIVAVSHGDPIMILKAFILEHHVTLASIRPGPVKYIKYGESFKVTISKSNQLSA